MRLRVALLRLVGCLLLALSATALEFMFHTVAAEYAFRGFGETYWPGIMELEAFGLAVVLAPLPLAAMAFGVRFKDYWKWGGRVAIVAAIMSAATILFFFV